MCMDNSYVCLLFHTNDCLSVSIPESVQIVAVGRVHSILHHASQFPLPCPGKISLEQNRLLNVPNLLVTFCNLFFISYTEILRAQLVYESY